MIHIRQSWLPEMTPNACLLPEAYLCVAIPMIPKAILTRMTQPIIAYSADTCCMLL